MVSDNPTDEITVLVTGARGLLGKHCHAYLLSRNAELSFHGKSELFNIRLASREDFNDQSRLREKLSGCDVVLHIAGINRATTEEVNRGNVEIAKKLVEACDKVGAKPDIAYSNSTHSYGKSAYGEGKSKAAELLGEWCAKNGSGFVDVVLPHLFGEGGVANYNTVTSTLCECLITNTTPEINDGAEVELMHAGNAAETLTQLVLKGETLQVRPEGRSISVQDLYTRLQKIHHSHVSDIIPKLVSQFEVQLYNTYRTARFVQDHPREFKFNEDERGSLFEAVRGVSGGQVFLSWTKPGVVRGNHFHRRKIERFIVLQGQALIEVRSIFESKVHSFNVNGEHPVAIDMPTLHTHNIKNVGEEPLLTLFWANEVFDTDDTDTYQMVV